ncbi:hypothetical protein DB347_11790 [Opitutaceae bacterium EW11]|nr:hypothetical protein DB347_11790 [Opitutaceae bacterium EW11]
MTTARKNGSSQPDNGRNGTGLSMDFVGPDGKLYPAMPPPDESYALRHDGRFWHIAFPIPDEPEWQQVFRGPHLPEAGDRDRWVRYRPYPRTPDRAP